MPDKYFFDTNLWIYLKANNQSTADQQKQKTVEGLVLSLPNILVSVQVLNEVANVLMKKYAFSETETGHFLDGICSEFEIVPLTQAITQKALKLKAAYQFSWFDSLIVSAALLSDSNFLYTEDMNDGLVVEKQLKIVNPFKM